MAQAVQSANEKQKSIGSCVTRSRSIRTCGKLATTWVSSWRRPASFTESENELTAAQKLAPNAEDVAVALGEVRRRLGDAKGAVAVLEPFVKSNPKAVSARIQLVTALRDSGEVESSIRHAHEVLSSAPTMRTRLPSSR